ncbi:hypothetical protein ABI_12180 [Asticcacaulis biprosthecium C19]|uniref:Uncharacterized protein n=1 Tax=Asticcacaulis biprosthecium C19 TaxID=715226 RepID=F4QHP2_9CAUL|nr:hypothetical protein ABI_12180 [Asticcacaulis biprosthecium C19]
MCAIHSTHPLPTQVRRTIVYLWAISSHNLLRLPALSSL